MTTPPRLPPALPAPRRDPLRIRRARARTEARRRVLARVTAPIVTPPSAAATTLDPPAVLALAFVGSLVAHSAITAVRWITPDDVDRPTPPITIEVRPDPVPVPEPAPDPSPSPAALPLPTPNAHANANEPRPPKPDPPKPRPPAPPDPAPLPPPRRVVGLSLESTSDGGDGPAYAVGNTQIGTTDTRAADPRAVDPAGAASPPSPPLDGPTDPAGTGNRAATRIPTSGVTITKPKRLREIRPAYPEVLRAQGIEADVELLVSIDEQGTVTRVEVVRGAAQPEFDEAAIAAARAERYEPATRNGLPFAYTLKFTTRFRLDDYRLFDFDQTHILTVVGSYRLPRNWEISARFRLVSGNPNTPITGSVYDASRDAYAPVYGELNSGRDGTFHQLDLRIDKRWIYESWMLSFYVDLQNAYDRPNPEGLSYNYDYSEVAVTQGLPILTIPGLKAEF